MMLKKPSKQALPSADETEYKEFVDKFKPKRTTDDCYTPDNVYKTVTNWVAEEYRLDRSRFVRPFWPGRDYQKDAEHYGPDTVVVDNPPFSIISQILQFYQAHGVKFFLFCPALTLFSTKGVDGITYLPTGVTVTFENGAEIAISFATNLDRWKVRTAPELYKLLVAANNENLKAAKNHLPKYSYPDYVITATLVQKWCHFGVDYKLAAKDCVQIESLDAMKAKGKKIFGKGFLLSERAAAERAAAERAAAEGAVAERWQLSEREWEIVKNLGKDGLAAEIITCLKQMQMKSEPDPLREWVPVEVTLPPDEDRVLCCTMNKKGAKNLVIGYYMDGMWRVGMNSNVIAWRFLPPAYGEVKDEPV